MNDLRPVHYAEVRPVLPANCRAVLAALAEAGPSTAMELALRMGWPITSVRPRICNLRDMELVIPTGARRNHQHVFMALPVERQMELV